MRRAAISLMLAQLRNEFMRQFVCQFVHTRVIVAEFREIPFNGKINSYTLLVAQWLNLGKFDSRQGINCAGQAGYTESHQTFNFTVMQGHLTSLIGM